MVAGCLRGTTGDHPAHSYAAASGESVCWFTDADSQSGSARTAALRFGPPGSAICPHRRQKPHHDALESQPGPDGLTSKRMSKLRYRAIRTATFEPSAAFQRRHRPGDAFSAKSRMNQRRACSDLMEDRGDFRGLGDQAGAAKRSYSAWAALRFSALTFKVRQL